MTVKVKFADFRQVTRSRSHPTAMARHDLLRQASVELVRTLLPPPRASGCSVSAYRISPGRRPPPASRCCLMAARKQSDPSPMPRRASRRQVRADGAARQRRRLPLHGGRVPRWLGDRINWRHIMAWFGAAVGYPLVARAREVSGPHPAQPMTRIGMLATEWGKGPFLQGLRDAGYVEGTNLSVEYRPVTPQAMLSRFAAELVAVNVDVIVAMGSQAARAARQATRTIPTVILASDPVATGFVASLARPGGDTTGMSIENTDLSKKRLELLREIGGGISPVVVLWNPNDPPAMLSLREPGRCSRAHHRDSSRRMPDRRRALDRPCIGNRGDPKAVDILRSPLMTANARRIAAWALEHRLPTIYWHSDFPEAGGG